MKKITRTKRAAACLLPLWITLMVGCASTPPKPDPFLQKWQTMAENKQGHSPASLSKTTEIPEAGEKADAPPAAGTEIATGRTLPKDVITLTMRQAEVQTVLRALAKMAGLNILVKEDAVKKESAKITVDFKKVPWDQVFTTIMRSQGLQYVWENDIIRIMNEADMKSSADQRIMEMRTLASEPLETKIIPIHYRQLKSGTKSESQAAVPRSPGAGVATAVAMEQTGDGNDFLNILWGLMSRDTDGRVQGSISVDGYTNSVIVKATKGDLRKIIRMIGEIDRPTPQIRIKANIVETTKEMARQLGIQWGGMASTPVGGSQNLWVTPGGIGGSAKTDPLAGGYTPLYGTSGISGHGAGVNFPATMSTAGAASLGLLLGTIGGNILEVQLNALQKDSKLNILSSPSITTLDNQTAFTENGEKVPITTIQVSGGVSTPTTRYEEAVMRLEITPHVIDGKSLKMGIVIKKDEIDVSRKDAYGNPYIMKKETRTSLIVQDNETIVISGLTKKTLSGGDTGVPLFKDVPVLGWLFKSDNRLDKMEEVLIFITPSILPPMQAAAVAAGGAATGNQGQKNAGAQ
ncbi:MAG: type IV pilus secretin PilQ [Syntrophus sp. (in: bacteria)]|nr:type IV pilus secretin PilQ [Syntrophus sp. (in: bacteria)]